MKKKEKISVNSSISMNKHSKMFAPEVIGNSKYKEIHEKFEKLFKSHGYFLSDSFDKKVWFLKDDLFFQRIINKNDINLNITSTPNENDSKNRIHEILSDLNDNTDYSHLLVNVEKFIYKVIEVLLISQSIIERSMKTIRSFNAVERKQNIDECIRLLEERIQQTIFLDKNTKNNNKNNTNNINSNSNKKTEVQPKSTKEFYSKLRIKILKALDFKPGTYYFSIKYFEIKSEKETLLMNQINYNLNKKLGLKINSSNQDIEEINEFEEIPFYALENILDSQTLKVKNNINSGTSFSNLYLVCSDNQNENKSNAKFESKKVYCLEIILNTLDNVLDISKRFFKENIEIKLYSNPHLSSSNPSLLGSKYSSLDSNNDQFGQIQTVILELNFELDEITRSSILKRIAMVFKEVLDTKQNNEDLINLILDGYFEIINDSVRGVLSKTLDIQKDACCDCLVF